MCQIKKVTLNSYKTDTHKSHKSSKILPEYWSSFMYLHESLYPYWSSWMPSKSSVGCVIWASNCFNRTFCKACCFKHSIGFKFCTWTYAYIFSLHHFIYTCCKHFVFRLYSVVLVIAGCAFKTDFSESNVVNRKMGAHHFTHIIWHILVMCHVLILVLVFISFVDLGRKNHGSYFHNKT